MVESVAIALEDGHDAGRMLDQLVTRALDDEANFWPFARSLPERDAEIPELLCVKTAVVHALLATAASSLLALVDGEPTWARFASRLPAIALALFVALYALLRFGFARAWNARARGRRVVGRF
jgi:hypothetical protein